MWKVSSRPLAMPLQAVTEIALHLGIFRNIDLYHQGLYHVRCRVFVERDGELIAAVPHPVDGASGGESALSSVAGAHTVSTSSGEVAFQSDSVAIRFCEQEVEMNNLCQFRVEQGSDSVKPLLLEVKLMFADVEPYGGTQQFDTGGGIGNAQDLPESEFSAVSIRRFRLHHTIQGVHAYCPVVFDERHFCQVGLMVHSCVVDYRLRLKPELPCPLESSDLSELTTPCISSHNNPDDRLQTRNRSLADELIAIAGKLNTKTAGSVAHGMRRISVTTEDFCETTELRLSRSVDRIHRAQMGRLLAARRELTAFLAYVTERTASSPPQQLRIPSIVLPGCGDPADQSLDASETPCRSKSLIPISSRLSSMDAASAARLLAHDLSFVSTQVLDVWQTLLKSMPSALSVVTILLHANWEQQVASAWGESVFRETCPASDVAVPNDRRIWITHQKIADALRCSKRYVEGKLHVIEDVSLAIPRPVLPVIFQQRYMGKGASKRNNSIARGIDAECDYSGAHVLVLVHGFQGNSFDMRLLKNNLALLHPKTHYLCSTANEDDSDCDIKEMGKRLAEEVKAFIGDICNDQSGPEMSRLSFIAHSVGGLIVRSALPLLPEYHAKLFTYCSLSSPHLGYMYAANTLFKTGLWVAKKIRKSECLHQLSMTDKLDKEDAFISELARTPGLEHFCYVALVSSYQDQYAPFESARIEIGNLAENDPVVGPMYQKLARSILDPIDVECIHRFDVNFHISDTSIDTMTGRAAHIQLIESQPLMKMFMHVYSFMFE